MANGIIIIDKPADWTSMDVCSKLRRLLNERRIGHAGFAIEKMKEEQALLNLEAISEAANAV